MNPRTLTRLLTTSICFFPLPLISSQSFNFFFFLTAAANQRETLKSPFHLKEEPKVEEALSPRPSSQSQSQVQPSYPATFCQDGLAGAAAAATERPGPLKPREGSPMAKNSLLSQDINVKVASELLMKLSGNSSKSKQKIKSVVLILHLQIYLNMYKKVSSIQTHF